MSIKMSSSHESPATLTLGFKYKIQTVYDQLINVGGRSIDMIIVLRVLRVTNP